MLGHVGKGPVTAEEQVSFPEEASPSHGGHLCGGSAGILIYKFLL